MGTYLHQPEGGPAPEDAVADAITRSKLGQTRMARGDVWTRLAANPIAFEPPSAWFALDWDTQAVWRQRGIGFVTVTHAAGISSAVAIAEC